MQRIPQFNLQAPAGAVCYYTTPVGIGTVAPNARQSFLSLMVVRHANVTSVFLLLLLLLLRHVPHDQLKLLIITKKNSQHKPKHTRFIYWQTNGKTGPICPMINKNGAACGRAGVGTSTGNENPFSLFYVFSLFHRCDQSVGTYRYG